MERLNDIQPVLGLNDRVYHVLKEAILQRVLQPGQRLDVNQLADRWNVSRTPVKDAIQRLMAEELIEVKPRRGTFVSDIRVQDVIEMLNVRLMFELHAAELAIRKVSGIRLQQLKRILIESDQLLHEPLNYLAYTDADIRFHTLFISWCENAHMLKLYDSQNFHWHTARVYYDHALPKALQGQKEHWDIYHAFENASLSDLKEAIASHIEAGKQGVMKLFEN